MELTNELLARYVGGQLEIQNQSEHYLYRGEIERAWIEGEEIKVCFKWLAKMTDGEWVSYDDLSYGANLILLRASEIGEGRLHYSLMMVGERGTFFPPDGSKLDPSRVKGLQLVS